MNSFRIFLENQEKEWNYNTSFQEIEKDLNKLTTKTKQSLNKRMVKICYSRSKICFTHF